MSKPFTITLHLPNCAVVLEADGMGNVWRVTSVTSDAMWKLPSGDHDMKIQGEALADFMIAIAGG